MACRLCRSEDQRTFCSEINIHVLQSLTQAVWAFPAILVCMACGYTELQFEETELQNLGRKNRSTGSCCLEC